MHIGPQGIVHGTTITVLNAFRKIKRSPSGGVFSSDATVESQPKAGNSHCRLYYRAEVNAKITHSSQPRINEVIEDIDELVKEWLWRKPKKIVSLAYLGNVVDVWENLTKKHSYRFGKRPDLPPQSIRSDIIQLAFPLRMRTK
jgi:urocanate hydratase